MKSLLSAKEHAAFDGIVITAIVDGAIKLAGKLVEEIDKKLLLDYIERLNRYIRILHKGIKQGNQVIKSLKGVIKQRDKENAALKEDVASLQARIKELEEK